MIAPASTDQLPDDQRIVITGIGLTSPNGNNLAEFRESLLAGKSGVTEYNIRYFGDTVAGICDFEATRHQSRRDARRGTRAGSVGIYCAREAIASAGIDWDQMPLDRIGVYVGVTEHGNVETETEIHEIKQERRKTIKTDDRQRKRWLGEQNIYKDKQPFVIEINCFQKE
jgi:3-oxoacyl-[acyl-carrier-protein] synthase II